MEAPVSLVRVQTVWGGVAGSPYYTNLYAIGPLTTNNGNDLADAWHAFLTSLTATLGAGMTATIDPELLEFDETTGTVTGAGSTIQSMVTFTGSGDKLPTANQLLIRWTTLGIVHNRRVRGRTFLPGGLESHNSASGAPLPVVGTPVQSAIDALLTTMSGRMRVWAQPFVADPEKPENPTRPGSAHAIQSGAVAPYWAILRSRRD
jgi:hypothetical protein